MAAPTWRPTRRSDVADAALAAVLCAAAGLSLYIGSDEALYGEMADYPRVAGIATVGLLVAPLALRRRLPGLVAASATAAYVPLIVLEVPERSIAPVAYFIALYSVGAYGSRGRSPVRAVAVVTICGLVVYELAANTESYPGSVSIELVNAFAAFSNVFYLAAAWMLGNLVHTRRGRERTLLAQADALQTAQGERARQAVRDEQVRIARELHDVVAHHVSVMGVQAGAARRVLAQRPDAVPDLLTSIEGSSRQAVAELHRMLALLRRDDDPGEGTAPPPTLARLAGLADQMRDAGLVVSVDVDGDTGDLPPSVDLSAFRIVQEALTNVLKHAGPGTTTTVDVVRRRGSLELVVRDDGLPGPTPRRAAPADVVASGGAPTAPTSTGPVAAEATTATRTTADPGAAQATRTDPGHGLVGMRERVTLLGGELKAGRHPGGGFQVRAWLPLAGAGG